MGPEITPSTLCPVLPSTAGAKDSHPGALVVQAGGGLGVQHSPEEGLVESGE